MAFKLIAITPELTLPDEAWRITHLLDAGFDAVHLRKPHCGEEEMRGYVDTLPAGIADRLAMHYFPMWLPKRASAGCISTRGRRGCRKDGRAP